ncbi:hypothetical protein BC628DRAFT_261234 [Trametes gibbosa]|nr:hypothetical protein BC628DRAFT_261234 [Trametes gibbosa]
MFPEAHIHGPESEYCSPPPLRSPYLPPSSYTIPSPGSPHGPFFPSGPEPSSYQTPPAAGHAPPPPPPPPRPYGNPAIPNDYYQPHAPGGQGGAQQYQPPNMNAPLGQGGPLPPPPPPQRPPAHPASSYSAGGGGSGGAPAFSSGPLGQAFNVVGNVAGQGAKTQLQNLANSGSKLFSKYRK